MNRAQSTIKSNPNLANTLSSSVATTTTTTTTTTTDNSGINPPIEERHSGYHTGDHRNNIDDQDSIL